MTKRFLAGLHPLLGTMGIWMTNAGIDVETNTSNQNFALSPDVKMEQIWFSGVAGVAINTTTIVYYPAALAKRPYIYFFLAFSNTQIEYPYPLSMTVANINEGVSLGMRVYLNRIEMSNGFGGNPSGGSVYFHYMVFRRSIGS